MPPARDKDPGADELPKAATCNETLFSQLSYTWYGTVCEASKKCWVKCVLSVPAIVGHRFMSLHTRPDRWEPLDYAGGVR